MEIEFKYRIPNDITYTDLTALSHVGRFSISTGHLVSFNDNYFDTENTHLLAAGYALRERHFDHDIVISLKSLSPSINHRHVREEIESHSPDIRIDQPDTWPDNALHDQVWRMTDGQSIKPLFDIYQDRFLRNVSRNDIIIAEMCVDRVRYQYSGVELLYLGLEVELAETGTENDLSSFCQELEQAFDLIPEKRSKYEIGLAFTQVPSELIMIGKSQRSKSPDIHLHDSMAKAAIKTFQYHFKKMKLNDAGTYRGEDIIYLHDMRVATRRMRTAYRVFESYIHKETMRPSLNVLKKTGKILGAVRDLDVFRENFEHYAATNHVVIHSSTLTSAWNSAYTLARNHLIEYLASNRYLAFRKSFDKKLYSIVYANQNSPTVAEQVWITLEGQRQQVITYYQQIEQIKPIPMHCYHQLRVYLKFFRYSVEYFRKILGVQGEEVITETKVIQDHLGALQDAVVARKQIKTVLQWGMWHPPQQPYTLMPSIHNPSPDVNAYLSYIEESIDQLVESFPGVWARFNNFLSDVSQI